MAELIGLFLTFVFFVIFFGVGYFAFHLTEMKREEYLGKMERELAAITVTDLRRVPEFANAARAELVTGSVVVANNYFLGVCASFRSFFGGEMKGYSQLCTDARRMALVRLKEEARAIGATSVCCLRYETMVIQSEQRNRKQAGGVELMAYGTALVPSPPENAA
ncbi:MAG: heavy metal-binding domain-containing protein [Lentisphaeria bacterium]|nr:heavy metal-binding domain-containing protein [Lentisphaeria bacterium]